VHAYVVAAGDRELDVASVLAERLDAMGLEGGVVMGPDPDTIDRGALDGRRRWVDPAWIDDDGRTLTAEQAARRMGHEAAWELVRDGDDAALVVDATSVVVEGFLAGLASATAGVDWSILHLCDEATFGAGYVLTPSAAGVLLDRSDGALTPLATLLASIDLDGFEIMPPLIGAGGAAGPGRVLTDHLVIVTVPGVDVPARAVALAEELGPGCVVLALPAGRSRVVGSPADILAEVAGLGAPSLLLPGPAVLTAGGVPVATGDAGRLVVHVDDQPGRVIGLGGRLLDVVTETEPLVVTTDDSAVLATIDAELHDLGTRDLARVLRYQDARAADLASGLFVVAAEIIQIPFWTAAFCATVIRAAEAVGAFLPDDGDPVPGHEISLAAISPRLFAHLEDDVAVRVMPRLHEVWPYVDYHGLRDAFVIKYAPGQQEQLRIHHDVAQVSASIKLNEGYAGATLEFPRQGWTTAGVPVGHLVVWPSLVTHPHRTTPLTAGVKYGLTIWFELPGE
jgi:hypothetical protein